MEIKKTIISSIATVFFAIVVIPSIQSRLDGPISAGLYAFDQVMLLDGDQVKSYKYKCFIVKKNVESKDFLINSKNESVLLIKSDKKNVLQVKNNTPYCFFYNEKSNHKTDIRYGDSFTNCHDLFFLTELERLEMVLVAACVGMVFCYFFYKTILAI